MESERQAIAARLEATRQALLDEIKDLSERDVARPTGIGSWTIKDIVGHIAAGERGQHILLWLARHGLSFPLPYYRIINLFNWYQTRRQRPKSFSRLLQELAESRQATLELLRSLPDEELARRVRHPVLGDVTVGECIAFIGQHEAEHLGQIRQALGRPGRRR
jgi:uncharacterized damage-inducible protein DinB